MTDTGSNEYREQRLANMEALAALGYAPFGSAFERTGCLAEIRGSYEDEKTVSAAGRLTTIRVMGKSLFADLRDGTDRLQVYAQKNVLGEDAFKGFKLLDIGDHIGVTGTLFTTRTGEKTIKIETWTLLSKALLPLPEKWHGLKDVEARYRQRYLDLATNPEVRALFNKRIEALRVVRDYLFDRDFLEVETPMMQSQAGGAIAKPFKTHFNALGTDMYLRVAPELYLKRLLVGGFDKVFELNRNFRNEGLDRAHNPEFTMLEIYEAYGDLSTMKALVQGLITHLAETVFGSLQVPVDEGSEETIDLTPPWREVRYKDLIRERMGDDWYDLPLKTVREKAAALEIELEPDWDVTDISHEIYEKVIEDTLIQPTFVTRFPSKLVPLARACTDDDSVVDVFELEIRGQEVAPAYTELNDPLEQRRRFEAQAAAGGGEIDEDFLTALEHGMPPAGGMGIGIDRLIAILSGSHTLRDVILFPHLRPK